MSERRTMPRWQVNQEAQLTLENGIYPIPCVVKDISPTGISISLRRNLFDEVFSNFKLAISRDFEISAGATVAWHDRIYEEEDLYGLSFNDTDGSLKERITGYLKENFPDPLVKQWWQGA